MSFQPTPTMVQPAVPPPPPAQQSSPPAKRGGGWLLWLGIGLLVAGIVGSIVTFVLQNNQYEQSVKKLARAVPGFSTRLDFQTSGAYSLYYENEGEFSSQLDGVPTNVKLDAPSEPVDYSATLTDADGNVVRIHDSSDNLDYHVAGHRGALVSTVDIATPGDYHLQIASGDPADDGPNTYAIALGKGQVSKPSVLWPALILGAGLILGAVAIIFGARQRRAPAAAPMPPGAFVAPPVSGPPGGYGYDPTAYSPGGYAPPAPYVSAGDPFGPPATSPEPDQPTWAGPPSGPPDSTTAPPPPSSAHQFEPPTQSFPTQPFPAASPTSDDPPTQPTITAPTPDPSDAGSDSPQAGESPAAPVADPWGAPRPPSEN